VNLSAAVVALVKPPTETVTSTVPVPAGLVATQLVELLQLTLSAELTPKLTAVVPVVVKPVPLIVTAVPPAVEPAVGLIAVTVGVGDVP